MAGAELAAQLAVLEAALQRLEAELAQDASWRDLQAGGGLEEAQRARLTTLLEANPVYMAWRNMRDAAAMLQQRQQSPAAPAAHAHAPDALPATLAEALQQLPPEDGRADADAMTGAVPQLLAAEVAAQVAPDAVSAPVPVTPPAMTAEEREHYEVGKRATQAVERILAIPVVEPIAPRTEASKPLPTPPAVSPTVAPPAAAAPPATESTAAPTLPPEAEDLAFLLTPATRATAEERPFLKRLVAEAQTAPTKATILQPSEPFMVPPAAETPSAPPPQEAQPEAAKEAGSKPRLARLLKAWSRN